MIEIIGDEGTSEYAAAESLAHAFEKMWRGCGTSPVSQDEIRIAANVKISGYRVSDIDLVVYGRFGKARKFVPTYPVKDMRGRDVTGRPILVRNFIVAIEVKDHNENGVNISGDRIDVRYPGSKSKRWHSATDQNVNQVHSLKAYLQDNGLDTFVHRCVIMRGLSSLRIPGAVCAGFSGPEFLTAISAVSRVSEGMGGFVLGSADKTAAGRIGQLPIFRKLIPTGLDRTKMDAIVKKAPESELLNDVIGRSFVVLRGRGGTGKTIMLLQAAWRAYESTGKRTLVLTYNHALAADIRRILALLRIPADSEAGGIAVETVMSFMTRWFTELGLVDRDAARDEISYEQNCETARELITGGAVERADIAHITESNADLYDFDQIVVDEAQDWPQSEADLLKTLYTPNRLALADGIDQLMRGARTNWFAGVDNENSNVIPLERCLRMKRNLAAFANAVGERSETAWQVVPNEAAGGGQVVILKRPYFEYPELHDSLVASAKANGNSELDFLFCVPSATVTTIGSSKVSDLGQHLVRQGAGVWEGVDPERRKDFPRSRDEFRVVQYASCRGLEGWTVVLEGLDNYWEECRFWRHREGLTEAEQKAFINLSEEAQRAAWFRALIAITRPIDTLVISLFDCKSVPARQVIEMAEEFREFVEVYD